MSTTTYLITGANRGIGRGLVEAYLKQPNNVVVAAVRDPNDPASKSLNDLPKGPSSSLIIVKINNTSETDAADAVKELETVHNIKSLDVVIPNSAIGRVFVRVEDAQTSDLMEYYHVNVIGVIILFRAVLPLLKKSQKTPKFIPMGSSAGIITDQEKVNIPNAVYGTSKAALNYIVKKIHLENEFLVAFPMHPGWVQTEMGNESARSFGLTEAPTTIEGSITGLMKLIDESTRESHSGKFASYDGTFIPY
ncbi:hypothetical protein PV08_08294 [Exophiala spinifera]|uniref:Norsolorinic acid ketoreductase n=1 Tax=Exophiala spinifera TaxID=91928 RepID=A0A0D1ZJW4_9EURO|nr:uncharacterized protein PV08_08294 [Exophiala spinifera]KIW13107.1 hypothetical protein PV08_08294 [Exophiala spinifera]